MAEPVPVPELEPRSLFTWQVLDTDGKWGNIAAVIVPGMSATPLIVRDRQMADRFKPIAAAHQLATGKRVRLARYDFDRELEVIGPNE